MKGFVTQKLYRAKIVPALPKVYRVVSFNQLEVTCRLEKSCITHHQEGITAN